MDRDALKKLIEDDDMGLLNLKPKASGAASADERLISSFREINDFVRKTGKEPQPNKKDVREMMLHSRLSALRADQDKVDALKEFDEFALLGESKPVESIADIFNDDDLGLLADAAENIFIIKNVPEPPKEINSAEYIAKRKPCQDFKDFEHLFQQCQQDLSAGVRKLAPFARATHIDIGQFFVLKGVLVYVASEHEREDQPGAEPGKMNDRLRCIFENGTESDMLRRSLAARLYEENGQRVSENPDKLFHTVNEITDDDKQTGFVYVLRSLSTKPEIKSLKNLYKIGFSRESVKSRIKNAAKEPTYLMAPVALVCEFQCYNLNPQKFELLLHHFFGSACLAVDVIDGSGRRCIPREWFVAPLEVINSAVQLLITGEIVHYRYNSELQIIEPK